MMLRGQREKSAILLSTARGRSEEEDTRKYQKEPPRHGLGVLFNSYYTASNLVFYSNGPTWPIGHDSASICNSSLWRHDIHFTTFSRRIHLPTGFIGIHQQKMEQMVQVKLQYHRQVSDSSEDIRAPCRLGWTVIIRRDGSPTAHTSISDGVSSIGKKWSTNGATTARRKHPHLRNRLTTLSSINSPRLERNSNVTRTNLNRLFQHHLSQRRQSTSTTPSLFNLITSPSQRLQTTHPPLRAPHPAHSQSPPLRNASSVQSSQSSP